MAQLGTRFDATASVAEQRNYEDVPDGIYRMEVDSADISVNSKETGRVLKLSYKIIEPEVYSGKIVFDNINLEHEDPKTQSDGQDKLTWLCRACGLPGIEDTDELRVIPFTAKVGIGKPSKDGRYAAKNEVKLFYFADEEIPAPVITGSKTPVAANTNRPAPAAANTNAAPAAAKKNPWSKAA